MIERIYVEIGNICNLSCSFCPGTKRPKRQMSAEEFERVARKIQTHAKYIYLHLMGEPLLHRELGEIIDIAGKYNLPVCITTNGTLLSQKSEILFENAKNIHKICISLHAPEGNENSPFANNYLQNAVKFAKKSASLGTFVVFRLWNMDSEKNKGKNRENEKIENALKAEFKEEWTRRRNGFRLSKYIFLEYDEIFSWPIENEGEISDDGTCHGVRSQLGILADGTVVPCCIDSEGSIVLGNIFEDTMEKIVNSERFQNMKRGFEERKMVEPFCQKCSFARRFK